MPPNPRIIADIGGTNARFANVASAASAASFSEPIKYLTAELSFADALQAFARASGIDPAQPLEFRAAVAAPVSPSQADGFNSVRLTNCDWQIGASVLMATFPKLSMRVVNDFAAVALALPSLDRSELTTWSVGGVDAMGPKIAIGPGTGLGVASIAPVGDQWLVLPGEGGHVTLSASNDREASILAFARRQFPHVSAERLLSGTGLPLLHAAVCAVDGLQRSASTAAEITDAVHQGEAASLATLRTFAAMLGSVAGNAALTVGATGGVYLAGGLMQHWRDLFPVEEFVAQFRRKGRFERYLSEIAIHRIDAAEPGLIGLARSV
jgi:glucokinase